MEEKDYFMQFCEKVKSLGYRVFVNEKYLSAFVVNEKDEYGTIRLHYCYGVGYTIKRSTENVPNSYNGCGYGLDGGEFSRGVALDEVTKEKIDEIVVDVPEKFGARFFPKKITFTEYLNTDAYWVHKDGLKEI